MTQTWVIEGHQTLARTVKSLSRRERLQIWFLRRFMRLSIKNAARRLK